MSTDLVNVPAGDQQPAASQPEQVETAPMGGPTESVTAITPTEVIPPSGTPSQHSGGTDVPAEFRFTETQYEPSQDVTSDALALLSHNDLLTGLKMQYSAVRKTHGQFGRDLGALVRIYDEVVARFKHERVSVNRNGEPTLQEAFFAIGWNYEAARKMRQRYNTYTRAIPDYASAPKPPQLAEGDFVMEQGKDGVFTVINVDGQANSRTVDIVPEGDNDATPRTVTSESLKKFRPRKVKVGDLLLCDDNGTEYKYEGHGRFSRTKTPTLLEQKRERELAAIKAQQERAEAKAEEQERRNALRKAEAARHDLDLIAEKADKTKTKAQLEAEAKQKAAKPKVARAQKPAKPEKTKTKAELAEENKRAEEKAKQEEADRARKAKNETGTEAAVAPLARYSTDEDGKLDCLRQGEEGEQIVQ